MNADYLARLPLILTVVLGLGIAYQLAEATWAALAPQPATGDGAAQQAAADRPPPDVDAIARAHLFGTADVTASSTPARLDAPDTRLNLTLRGISASSKSEAKRS